MKKVILILISLLIVCLLFTGCSSNTQSGDNETTNESLGADNATSETVFGTDIISAYDDYDCISIISPCFSYDETCTFFNTENSAPSIGYEPKLWTVNYGGDTNEAEEVLKVKGFKHLHTANVNSNNEWFFTGVDNNNEYYLFKICDGIIVSKMKIDTLPDKSYIYGDTVILLQKDSNDIGILYKAKFNTEELEILARNIDCYSGVNNSLSDCANIFTYGDKLLYKTEDNNWTLYSDNSVSSYEFKGYCGGFSDGETVVFYQPVIKSASMYSISKLSLSTGKSTEKKTLKLPKNILNNSFMSCDGNYLFIEYGTLDDNHNGVIISMYDYSTTNIYWYPSGTSSIQTVPTAK